MTTTQLHLPDAAATRALGAALAEACAPAISSSSLATSAPGRRRSPRASVPS